MFLKKGFQKAILWYDSLFLFLDTGHVDHYFIIINPLFIQDVSSRLKIYLTRETWP